MAELNQFIGDLPSGGTVRAGDKIPVEREDTPGTPENFYVTSGTAGTKAASDDDQDTVASVSGSTSAGHLAVFADASGTIGDGGLPGAAVTDATPLTPPVLTTDLVPIIRGGVIYLATVDELLNAQPPAGAGGQFDFSDPANSALAALI